MSDSALILYSDNNASYSLSALRIAKVPWYEMKRRNARLKKTLAPRNRRLYEMFLNLMHAKRAETRDSAANMPKKIIHSKSASESIKLTYT